MMKSKYADTIAAFESRLLNIAGRMYSTLATTVVKLENEFFKHIKQLNKTMNNLLSLSDSYTKVSTQKIIRRNFFQYAR